MSFLKFHCIKECYLLFFWQFYVVNFVSSRTLSNIYSSFLLNSLVIYLHLFYRFGTNSIVDKKKNISVFYRYWLIRKLYLSGLFRYWMIQPITQYNLLEPKNQIINQNQLKIVRCQKVLYQQFEMLSAQTVNFELSQSTLQLHIA